MINSEMILVVDDEPLIVRFIVRMLEDEGYHVVSTSDSGEAMGVFEQSKELIRLVLTDVMMPGLSGKDLAILIQKEKPAIQVLYMSGYQSDVLSHQGLKVSDIHFIAKPFTRDSLCRKIREILSRKAVEPSKKTIR